MIYFISDVHLGLGESGAAKRRETLFIDFLDRISHDAETIVFAGDIFDYWFDYRSVVPRDFFRTLAAIDRVCARNIPILYIAGNHDFGHYTFFHDEFGIDVRHDHIELISEQKRFFIAHGDGKTVNDFGSKTITRILHSPLANRLYRLLHPDLGIRLASGSSTASRAYSDERDFGVRDGLFEFAQSKVGEGFDYVIMGHKHNAEWHQMGDGVYCNLGHWLGKRPTYAVFSNGKLNLLDLDGSVLGPTK